MGVAGDGRLIDIVYYAFVLFTIASVLYFIGWILGRIECKEHYTRVNLVVTICFCAVIGVSVLSNSSWAGVALSELHRGIPQEYSKQAHKKDMLFRQSEGCDLEVEPFSDISKIIFFRDITTDMEYWRNKSLAKYYNINSVRLCKDYE